jgi:4'-phosphopantetheinyl transferase
MLPHREVHIWFTPQPLVASEALLACVPVAEQQQAQQMQSTRRRTEWLAGRALMRQCLAYYTGLAPLELVLGKTTDGKPVLLWPDKAVFSAWDFNLSHGPRWIGCAVAQASHVGLDIDCQSRRNDTDAIAARYFHTDEQTMLASINNPDARRVHFFRHWTLKEAYIKSIGQTINSVRLHDIAFAAESDKPPQARFTLPSGDWQFMQQTFDGDHQLALACCWPNCDTETVAKPAGTLRSRFWLWQPGTSLTSIDDIHYDI